MPRKKQTKINTNTKKMIIASLAMFFGIMSLVADKENGGLFGVYLQNFLYYFFGDYYKQIFSFILIFISINLFLKKDSEFGSYKTFGLIIYFSSITSIIGIIYKIFFNSDYIASFNFLKYSYIYLGTIGSFLIFFFLFIFSLIILFRFSPIQFIYNIFNTTKKIKENLKGDLISIKENSKEITNKIKKDKELSKALQKQQEYEKMLEELKKQKEELKKAKQTKNITQLQIKDAPKQIKIEKKSSISSFFGYKKQEEKKEQVNNKQEKEIKITNFNNWQLPSIDLLKNRGGAIIYDENEIKRKEIEIQEKLLQFRIDVEMVGYQVGPTVIQYRLKPKPGVSLNKIVKLKKDLTLALHAKNIRIQAPIPGLGVVGIEVPNDNRQAVGLKEVIDSRQFKDKKLKIPLALGKDVSGNIVVGDLAGMPHLLIAGQTGSGKSVGMNGFLISMLYKFSPSELKFIMVDPKRVELSVYNGIPHLLTPVITSPDKALNALKWCVAEMLRRYDMAVKIKARNLQEYNNKVSKEEKLPYIVIVIDELADLMMSGNKKEVEQSISRIAQMARAVGMHLIIATQRPSTDVITGLIKANIPSRIAFTVASHIDSQTVLGKKGAEDLLGRGDMLYYPTGAMEAERVQGVFVETSEVEAVVNQIKLTIDPDMLKNMQDDSIINGVSKKAGSILEGYEGDQDEDPEMIEKAMEIVKQAKKGSTSLIQRKLGVGYARAAKILDILEDLGVVGPANGSKPREVYID